MLLSAYKLPKIAKIQQKLMKNRSNIPFWRVGHSNPTSCVPRASKCIQTCEKHVNSRKFSKNDEKIDVTHHFGGLAILPHPSFVPRASECIETREKRPKSWKEKNYEKNDHKGKVIIQLLDQQLVMWELEWWECHINTDTNTHSCWLVAKDMQRMLGSKTGPTR